MMKILATAKVNDQYIWKSTFAKCKIDAVLENGDVKFIEYFNGKVNMLSEELVRSLFPLEVSVHDRPFLIRDNKDFYTVLHRNKPRNHVRYEELLAKTCEEDFKPKKVKRTK